MSVSLQKVQFQLVLASGDHRWLSSSVLKLAEAKLDQSELDQLHKWLQSYAILVEKDDVQVKEALYYYEKGRKYRPTKHELEKKQFLCPKCKIVLRKTVYKLRGPLFTCPDCAWSIRRDDIWTPGQKEEPVVRGPGDATSWLKP